MQGGLAHFLRREWLDYGFQTGYYRAGTPGRQRALNLASWRFLDYYPKRHFGVRRRKNAKTPRRFEEKRRRIARLVRIHDIVSRIKINF